jgi:tetratricopeptide (TPR) repeat protein
MAGEVEESGAILIRLAEIHPDQMLLVPILGEIATGSPAQRPAMEARLRNFLRIAPKHGSARYYLAELLAAGLPEPPAEAIRLWQEAASLDTGDARPCLAMARVEQARNRSTSAIGWLTRALERDPASAEAHYHLARLYFRTGQRDLGNQHLKQFHALRK